MEELPPQKNWQISFASMRKKCISLSGRGVSPHVRITGKWLFPKGHVMRRIGWIDQEQRQPQIWIRMIGVCLERSGGHAQ